MEGNILLNDVRFETINTTAPEEKPTIQIMYLFLYHQSCFFDFSDVLIKIIMHKLNDGLIW